MRQRKFTPNNYRIEGDTAILSLTQGQETRIDVADLPLALRYCWCAAWDEVSRRFYVLTSDRSDGRHRTLRLHRLLLNAPSNRIVDHKNHDTLDNRRANLRLVTRSQNSQNRERATRLSTTGIRGVSVQYDHGGHIYYRATVRTRGKSTVRLFPHTPEGLAQAARAVVEMRLALMTHSDGR